MVRKLVGQARLLRRDPEAFARNLTQYTHPAKFLAQLKDVPEIATVPASADAARPATLNILLPAIGPSRMTGGPNTVLLVGCAIAEAGLPVRFHACDSPVEGGPEWFAEHIAALTGRPGPANVSLSDGILRVGHQDLFMASFWTTAYQANALLKLTRAQRFIYLIQDFEAAFYPWSSRYAMALHSYDLPYHPIVNEAMLADFLAEAKIGRFAEPGFRETCSTFEPALDSNVFKPARRRTGPHRLLVYTRPSNPRNLLGMALAAVEQAEAAGAFIGEWEFLAIGARGSMPEIRLASGRMLKPSPWTDYQGYARLLQDSDVLLCPMLSPHSSYPVLEMAACGGISVTNTFATKTAAKLAEISPNILAAQPTQDDLTVQLARAAQLVANGRLAHTRLQLPESWQLALAGIVKDIERISKESKEALLF